MPNIKLVIIGLLIILIVFYLVFSFYVAWVMTSRLAPHIESSPTVISESYEDVEFKTSDKLTLRGWYFPGSNKKAVIMVHGLLPNRVNNEYFGPIIAKELVEQGFSVLVYDTRAHGESDGIRVGFGSNEGEDVIAAVKFLEQKNFKPNQIGIIGVSTGAISTLMVLDRLTGVGAIIADSPASDFSKVVSDRLWKEKSVPTFFHPAIFLFNKLVFRVDINSVKPIDKVKVASDKEVLYLHGKNDETIPIDHAKELVDSGNKNSKLVIFPRGGHIETFKSDPQLYRNSVYIYLHEKLD